jgi:hypothetical protein
MTDPSGYAKTLALPAGFDAPACCDTTTSLLVAGDRVLSRVRDGYIR